MVASIENFLNKEEIEEKLNELNRMLILNQTDGVITDKKTMDLLIQLVNQLELDLMELSLLHPVPQLKPVVVVL